MKKHKLTYNDYKRYIDKKMSAEEQHDFEKQMMLDSFDEEAFEGLQQISGTDFQQDVENLNARIENSTQNKKQLVPSWMRYAAAAAIIIGLGISSILYFNNNPKYDLDYNTSQEKSLAIADTSSIHTKNKPIDTNTIGPKALKEKVQMETEPTEQTQEKNISTNTLVEEDHELETEVSEFTEIELNDEVEKELKPDVSNKQFAEAVQEESATEKQDEPISNISGNTIAPAAKSERMMKKSVSRAKSTQEVSINESNVEEIRDEPQNAGAPILKNKKVMPPKGLSYEHFRETLTENIKTILNQYGENQVKLTLSIEINEFGIVTSIDVKETLKQKTTKKIEKHIKDLGKWQAEIENGVAIKTVRVITLTLSE